MSKKHNSVQQVDNPLTFHGEQHMKEASFEFYQFSLSEYITKKDTSFNLEFPVPLQDITTWMHVKGVHDLNLVKTISKKFQIHRLVQQDIVDTNQRPKIQVFENFLFITTHVYSVKNQNFEQMSFVFGRDFLISFQESSEQYFAHIKKRIKTKKGYVCEKKEDYLFYLLLESILDNFFQRVNKLSVEIEAKMKINDLDTLNTQLIIDIEEHKKHLFSLRKKIMPIKDILSTIERNNEFVEETNRKYYYDLQDQCTQLIEDIDLCLVELESGVNLFFSMQGHRTNQIVQTLTIVSTIFIPLTFLAGIYGMNFDRIPELKAHNGYFILLGVMSLITIGLLLLFKRRKWF